MPPLPDVAQVLKIEYTFALDEDLGAKTRHFVSYAGVPPTNAQLNTFATAVRTSFVANLDDDISATYSLEAIDVTDLSSSTAAIGANTTSAAGTRAGDIVPASAAVVISRKIARRFRGGHSRMYWPMGVQADLQDAQTWTAAFVAAVAADWAAHSTAVLAAGWTSAGALNGVAVSYYQGFTVFTGVTGRARNVSTVRTTPVVDVLTADVVRVGVGSQRGRLLHLA